MLRFFQIAVSVILAILSFSIAPMCATFGLLGLTGRLADTSHGENLVAGLYFSGIAVIIWISAVAWYAWVNQGTQPQLIQLPTRFSLRTVLIVITLAAVVFGLIAISSR
jgi:hypothetical protein